MLMHFAPQIQVIRYRDGSETLYACTYATLRDMAACINEHERWRGAMDERMRIMEGRVKL